MVIDGKLIQEKIKILQQDIIDECTKNGIRANIITIFQFGEINIFPQLNNSKHFKKKSNDN